jgi:hypothetical protein
MAVKITMCDVPTLAPLWAGDRPHTSPLLDSLCTVREENRAAKQGELSRMKQRRTNGEGIGSTVSHGLDDLLCHGTLELFTLHVLIAVEFSPRSPKVRPATLPRETIAYVAHNARDAEALAQTIDCQVIIQPSTTSEISDTLILANSTDDIFSHRANQNGVGFSGSETWNDCHRL